MLSVVSPLDEPAAMVATEAIATEQQSLDEQLRIGVWTPELIEDVRAWVDSQDWPEGITVPGATTVEVVHMPIFSDSRGGYRTLLDINPATELTADEAIAALEQTEFVDFAKLASESAFYISPGAQESIDRIKDDASDGTNVYLHDEDNQSGAVDPVELLVGLWSNERISDMKSFVAAKQWPDALTVVEDQGMETLLTQPFLSDPRGGFQTLVRMSVRGDLTSLEQGNADTFLLKQYDGDLYIVINGTQLPPVRREHVATVTITGSSDADTMTVGTLPGFEGNVVLEGQGAGAADIAHVYDTPGRDVYAAYASWGGDDHASLMGSQSPATNEFLAIPGSDYIRMYDPLGTYNHRVRHFPSVYCQAGSVSDIAYLFDTTGDDTFTYYAAGDGAHMAPFALLEAGAFEIEVANCATILAYADLGNDTALLYGTSNDDQVLRDALYTKLYGNGFSARAKYFENVTAYGNGGDDTAYLFDSVYDDILEADDNWAEIRNSTWRAKVEDFLLVNAYSENGDDDDTDITSPLFDIELYGPWDQ